MAFTSDNQPAPEKRSGGPSSIKRKIIEALGRANLSEEQFIDMLVLKALDEGGIYLQELLKRYSPLTKQTFETIAIVDWPKNGTPIQKAEVILNSMASGDIPPDLGALFIESISKSLGIEEITELAKRLEALEAIINDKANK
jgi:hypothetical protein